MTADDLPLGELLRGVLEAQDAAIRDNRERLIARVEEARKDPAFSARLTSILAEDREVLRRLAGRSPEIHAAEIVRDGTCRSQRIHRTDAELEDPIDYGRGLRVLSHAEPIDDEVDCPACLLPQVPEFSCVRCGAAIPSELVAAERTFQTEARESISAYAARMAQERDVAVKSLEAIASCESVVAGDGVDLARTALNQIRGESS